MPRREATLRPRINLDMCNLFYEFCGGPGFSNGATCGARKTICDPRSKRRFCANLFFPQLVVFYGPNTFFRADSLSTEGTYSYNATGDFLNKPSETRVQAIAQLRHNLAVSRPHENEPERTATNRQPEKKKKPMRPFVFPVRVGAKPENQCRHASPLTLNA